VYADTGGYVGSIAARGIGLASQRSGAGRDTKDAAIDLSAGVILQKKAGDAVKAGDALAVVCGNDGERLPDAAAAAKSAFRIDPVKPEAAPLVYGVITDRGK
jgi:thymidine phosphorylase